MSLKAFHLGFIVISVTFTAGFAVWAIRDYRARGQSESLILGIGSVVACVALLIYGRWFLVKLKGTSYL